MKIFFNFLLKPLVFTLSKKACVSCKFKFKNVQVQAPAKKENWMTFQKCADNDEGSYLVGQWLCIVWVWLWTLVWVGPSHRQNCLVTWSGQACSQLRSGLVTNTVFFSLLFYKSTTEVHGGQKVTSSGRKGEGNCVLCDKDHRFALPAN